MTRYDFPSVAAVRIAAKRLSIERVKLGGRTLYDPADWEEATDAVSLVHPAYQESVTR